MTDRLSSQHVDMAKLQQVEQQKLAKRLDFAHSDDTSTEDIRLHRQKMFTQIV